MKVTEALHAASNCKRDQWGTFLPAGTEMFAGYHYDKVNAKKYSPLKHQYAVVPVASPIFVCTEIDSKQCIKIPDELNFVILTCVEEVNASMH